MAQVPEDARTPGAKRTADCRKYSDKRRLELVLSDKVYSDFRNTLGRAARAGVVTSKPDFIALLLNLYKAQEVVTGNVSEPVEVVTGNNSRKKKKVVTGNISTAAVEPVEIVTGNVQVQEDQQEVVTGNISEPAVDPAEVVTGNTEDAATTAKQLLQAHSTYAAAIAALKEDIKAKYPGWSVHNKRHKGTALEPAQNWYDKVRYKLQKLSTNQ